MDEDTTTEVAGTAQPATTGEGSSQGAPDVSGFQARINELTAKAHAAEREAQAAKEGFQQAMERVARLEGRVEAGGSAQTAKGFDYEVFGEAAPHVKAALDAQAAAFQRQLAQLNASVNIQLQANHVKTLAAQQQLPPAVTERALHLTSILTQKYGSDANADDALKLAIGEAVIAGTYKPSGPAGSGGRAMSAPPGGATLHGGTPPLGAGGGGNGQSQRLVLPTNFEDMTPQDQMAFLQKNKINTDFDL